MNHWAKITAAVLAVMLGLSACGGDDDGGAPSATGFATGSFVGLVDDTDAYIAIVSAGAKLAGYVCDGKTVSLWFKGDVGDNAARLTARTEQDLGEVEFLGDTADGEIEIDGERHSFSAELAVGDAGLYRAFEEAGSVEVGWVLLNDGSQRGATNFIDPITSDRTVKPAPNLDPAQSDVSVNVGGNAIQLAQQQVTQQFIDPIVEFRPR